ncbi:hypothetical protein Dda_9243 [Drechslerella dactyloides]|uniref:Zn(2)-C6 fungal-type domain-containing protein n=1 Tax=Drechslerella dactyloides TaxID=74499 RepID=A0AAD6NFB4_DREDA|nr:hypothetical protein Dda_9243 [Drechslerella dactyloides]
MTPHRPQVVLESRTMLLRKIVWGIQPQTARSFIRFQGELNDERRCTGSPAPCEACSAKGRECVFEKSLDGRRKEATGLALGAARAKHRAYEKLFKSLRSPNEELVNTLVNAIRKGSKLPELSKLAEEYETEGDGGVIYDGGDEGEGEDEWLEMEDEEEVVAGPSCPLEEPTLFHTQED